MPHPTSVPLEQVICRERFAAPARSPDYRREAEAFVTLARQLADRPENILRALCETAMSLVGAGSAGVSIADSAEGEAIFRWYAIAGRMTALVGTTMPRHFSPSGVVVDTASPHLMLHPDRHYEYMRDVKMPLSEVLLVPFRDGNAIIGTLWAVIHDDEKKFDSEDLRLLTSLASVASSAYQAQQRSSILASDRLKLQSIFDVSAMGMALVRGPELVFEKVNSEFEALVSPRAYVGKRWMDVYTEITDSPLPGIMQAVLATGVPYSAREAEVTVLGESGELENRWYDFTYTQVQDDLDQPYGVLIQSLNVTRQIEVRTELMRLTNRSEESRKFLETTLTSIGDAVIATTADPVPKISFLNAVAEKLTGWKQTDAVGKPVEEVFKLVHPRTREQVADPIGQVIAEGKIAGLAHHAALISKTGREIIIEDNAAPILNETGKVDGVVLVFRDTTEKRVFKERFEVLSSVIEYSKDFIGVATPDGQSFYVNPAGRDLMGLTSLDDVAGRDVISYFAEEEHDRVRNEILPKAMRDGFWDGRVLFRNFVTAEKIPVSWNLFAIRDPETRAISALACLSRDLREQDRKDAIVEEAKLEAERANSAKSAFLANMSHEIRSPLGAIMGFSDMLKTPGLTREETLNFVSVIDRNSNHLLRVVDDILDLSKVEAGKMLIENIEVSLPELLAEFASLMKLRAKEKGIEFDLRIPGLIPARVISDPTRLRQILNNVVGNAIKFTEQGRVQMSVQFRDGMLEFTVSDTGTGISAESAEKLFQPFQQGDVSTTRKFGGTGLGLVLTRRLAEALGGTFRLHKSTVGGGSVFIAKIAIELPADVAMVASKGQEFRVRTSTGTFEDGEDLKGMRILVVEDSDDNQELFVLYLTRVGASVDLASDGHEGVNLALTNEYDAVLMDVQMPRMDGHQATRSLREKGYLPPIIALTAHAMKEERDRAVASGFSDFLSKPVQRDALVEMLTKYHKPAPRLLRSPVIGNNPNIPA